MSKVKMEECGQQIHVMSDPTRRWYVRRCTRCGLLAAVDQKESCPVCSKVTHLDRSNSLLARKLNAALATIWQEINMGESVSSKMWLEKALEEIEEME